ncbi:unnamed protein product [Hapterophycus canaliculatus]
MTATISDAVAEAARLAVEMGSTAVDVVSFMADLGEELPMLRPALKTLKAVREAVESVKSHREEVAMLRRGKVHLHYCMLHREVSAKCKLDDSGYFP